MSKLSKKGVEDALGIPSIDELQKAMEILNNDDNEEKATADEIKEAMSSVKEMKKSLQLIPDILEKENEIDQIAENAARYFEDVMDRGFNSEGKFAGHIFDAANNLLKTALEAKATIINAKLRLLDLELKKQKMQPELGNAGMKTVEGSEVLLAERNSLLKRNK